MLDIRKMERPHRSGVIAIAVAYTLLYIAVDFTSLGNTGDGTWKDLVICHLMPWSCIGSTDKFESPPRREYAVTRLMYCPKCPVRKREKGCHFWKSDGSLYLRCPTFEAASAWCRENPKWFTQQPFVPIYIETWDWPDMALR